MELSLNSLARTHAISELQAVNALTERYGLYLSDEQIQNLLDARQTALADTGRVELGRGIIGDIIYAFCDSAYITQDNYEETLIELIDSFYYFKNESEGYISDEELIELMRTHFDGECQGSLEYLRGTTLVELCRSEARHAE